MEIKTGSQLVTVGPARPQFVQAPPHPSQVVVPVAGPPGHMGVDGAQGPPGPPGPQGDPGGAFSGAVMWSGQGAPPEVLLGAKPGDYWIDTLTGDIYTLT